MALADLDAHQVEEARFVEAVVAQHFLELAAVELAVRAIEGRGLPHRLAQGFVRHDQPHVGDGRGQRDLGDEPLQRLGRHAALHLHGRLDLPAEHARHLRELPAIGVVDLVHLDPPAADSGDGRVGRAVGEHVADAPQHEHADQQQEEDLRRPGVEEGAEDGDHRFIPEWRHPLPGRAGYRVLRALCQIAPM